MSPNPKPISGFLTAFDAPADNAAARSAPPVAPPRRVPAPANESIASEPDPDATARAFALGKEEGLKLGEARAALDRRRREMADDRRSRDRLAEAETRIGSMLAERLENEIAALSERIEADLVRCLVPVAHGIAERRAVDLLAREAASVAGASRWTVCGPDRLIEAFLERVPEELRERIDRQPTEGAAGGVDLCVEIDAARLSTRLGELRERLEAL